MKHAKDCLEQKQTFLIFFTKDCSKVFSPSLSSALDDAVNGTLLTEILLWSNLQPMALSILHGIDAAVAIHLKSYDQGFMSMQYPKT